LNSRSNPSHHEDNARGRYSNESAASAAAAATTECRPSHRKRPTAQRKWRRASLILVLIATAAAGGAYAWKAFRPTRETIATGNGRIEATDIDIAAKIAGRIEKIFVAEGEFVKAGQLLVQMQTDTLEAQVNEARAQHEAAIHNANAAEAQVSAKQSEKAAAIATVAQRQANWDAAHKRLERTEKLTREKVDTPQQLDDDRASENAADAAVKSAQAQVEAAQAAIEAARAQLVSARSNVTAAGATIARIEADIRDSGLTAPRDGRVQYKIAQEREVLSAGGKVLNMVDLADVT
jgi:HlyD family secretion protein